MGLAQAVPTAMDGLVDVSGLLLCSSKPSDQELIPAENSSGQHLRVVWCKASALYKELYQCHQKGLIGTADIQRIMDISANLGSSLFIQLWEK